MQKKYWASLVNKTKESACNEGDLGSIPGLERSSGEGDGNPLQYYCLEESHGQRSLVSCSPWDHKELGTTERLTLKLRDIKIKINAKQYCGLGQITS